MTTKMPYEVQIKVRGSVKHWRFDWGTKHKGEAIEQCGARNRVWAGGEAAHRVIDTATGEEVYRRGWVAEGTK